jgi:hypothetical protein
MLSSILISLIIVYLFILKNRHTKKIRYLENEIEFRNRRIWYFIKQMESMHTFKCDVYAYLEHEEN